MYVDGPGSVCPTCTSERQEQYERIQMFSTSYEVKESRAREYFKPENFAKNRYESVFPYDATRVLLMKSATLSDYINASWVPGYMPNGTADRKRFICTQGPLIKTIDDFWRMIHETRSRLIFMLSREVEDDMEKVATYWPYGPSGPIAAPGESESDRAMRGRISKSTWSSFHPKYVSVVPIREKLLPKSQVILREFRVSAVEGTEEAGFGFEPANVVQVHFYAWPDHDVPDSPEQFLSLFRICQAEEVKPGSSFDLTDEELTRLDTLPLSVNPGMAVYNGPITVHCSAGVGRTGTFVALHNVFRQMSLWVGAGKRIEDFPVEIEKIVTGMRECRRKMVQTFSQYNFLFTAVSFVLQHLKHD